MSLKRLLGPVLLMLFLLAAVASHAQQQAPLFPAPSGGGTAPDQPAAAPSIVGTLGFYVVRAEATFSRQLNSAMAAIRNGTGSLPLLGGILAAFLYGVFHTLAVGHGKTVVVGYFLGNRARPIHGIGMASWIAASHVLGAIVVALAAHWILARTLMSPIEQNHWIRLISFGAIAVIGGWMLIGAWRRLHGAVGHHHCHGHGHDHDHDHHHRGGGAGHRRLLAVAAGFVPCSGAILILTFAFANGILGSGLMMVLAIAVGMALTLAGLGLASMLLHHQVSVRFAKRGKAARWLGLIGPFLILVIGGLLFSAEAAILAATASN